MPDGKENQRRKRPDGGRETQTVHTPRRTCTKSVGDGAVVVVVVVLREALRRNEGGRGGSHAASGEEGGSNERSGERLVDECRETERMRMRRNANAS